MLWGFATALLPEIVYLASRFAIRWAVDFAALNEESKQNRETPHLEAQEYPNKIIVMIARSPCSTS